MSKKVVIFSFLLSLAGFAYGQSDSIPNVFTPNGDGVNDVFYISNSNVKMHDISIYNRWGEIIFQFTAPKIEWYGYTFAGDQVPQGTYFYSLIVTLEAGGTEEKSGTITLLR